jgi:simple sugar transport system permease protein
MENKPVEKPAANKPDSGKILLEEITNGPSGKPAAEQKRRSNTWLVPVFSIITGLIMGAILIVLTSPEVYAAFGKSFGAGMSAVGAAISGAYGALFKGSIGDPAAIMAAIKSGDAAKIRYSFNPFLESLVTATPYIFAGLAVALGFRSGLFNIGVEGQLYIGAACSTFVGYAVTGLPGFIHMPLALLAGAVGGGIWGFIPGWLKAKTGGHEVINTIMMNWIAINFTGWLVSAGPLQRPNSGGNPISPEVLPSAQIPHFFPDPIRFHLGFFIALLFAWIVSWFLFKTTWGFNLRTVGANPNAGKYAGMNIVRNTVIAMTLSGALAGLAGANQILAVDHTFSTSVSAGYGFDSIALALLGNSTPLGVVLASLLFGFLNNGATQMMRDAFIPISIISVIQSFIIVFIAAPAVIRAIYRIRELKAGEGGVTIRSWGGNQ